MARTVRDTNLETRAARLRLAPRGKPYWRIIESGLHLGYRRLRQGGGTWIARRFLGNRRYSETALGVADDLQNADAVTVLSFRDAQEQAREWWKAECRRALGLEEERCGPYTIAAALEDYTRDYKRRGGKDLTNVLSITQAHILPAIGHLEVGKLTSKKIRDWHHSLATAPKLVRTAAGAEQRNNKQHGPDDTEAIRRRRSRANRILTVLKAALNHGFAERLVDSDQAWRRVQPFHNVDRPSVRYLSEGECLRLVNACDPDFRALVTAAIQTGGRYGELIALRACDVDLEASTIHIRESKSGKPRHVPLTNEAVRHFASQVAGLGSTSPVFTRVDGRAWKRSEQARRFAAACRNARIEPAITFHGLRDTFASLLAMKGAPMGVIAALLGHADTRITEKHYAHLAPNYVAQALRAHFPEIIGERTTSARLIAERRP